MKEKDNSMNLAARLSGKDENNNLRRHPLYSIGEDFYSISHEKKDIDTEIVFTILGIKRKDELSSNRDFSFNF